MIRKNVELGPILGISRWRKMALGSWGTPTDPSIYGVLELDAGKVLERLAQIRAKDPETKITVTHFAAKAVAAAMVEVPQLNAVLRFGQLHSRRTVDVCFQVADDSGGANLSGATLRDVPNQTLKQVADFLKGKANRIRTEGDPEFRGVKRIGGGVPGPLMGMVVRLLGFVMYGLNLWSPILGLGRDAFGSVLITNIGSLGLDFALPALFFRGARCPVIVALGEVRPAPVVVNNAVVVRPVMKMCVTFDHRFVDGVHAGKMAKRVRECFANPEVFLN